MEDLYNILYNLYLKELSKLQAGKSFNRENINKMLNIINIIYYNEFVDSPNNILEINAYSAYSLNRSGESAYEIAVRHGYVGSESDWLQSLIGKDGLTPSITEDGYWQIGAIITDIKARGVDGKDGADGADGVTPHIGANGDWFIGDTDTGVHAQGEQGEQGPEGPEGPVGPAGSDADVTSENIQRALGYMPYNKPQAGIPDTDLAQGVIPDVSQFITNSVDNLVNYYLKSETYTKDEVAALIGAINQFHYEMAARTSDVTNPQSNVLYLIGPTGTGSDRYEEYVYPNSTAGFVKIGDTSIDLSGYVTTSTLNTALESKVEKIAGKGLSTNDYDNVEKNKVSTAYNNRPWARGQGENSAALGEGNIASGARSVAEGSANLADGDYSHVEGYSSQASGQGAHSEGQRTIAQGNYSHSEGIGGIHNAEVLFSGSGTSYTTAEEHEFTTGTILKFRDIVAKVISTPSDTSFITDIALSESPIVDSNDLYVVGGVAIGVAAHSEGTESIAQGENSHAEGYATVAKGVAAHAEGYTTKATGNYSHTEGRSTKAKFAYCHSEGNGCITGASASHAEGYKSETGGTETSNTKKAGTLTTKGSYAHAEGNASLATGVASHTEGKKTFTQNEGEHAEGLFNKSNKASDAYGNAGNTQHSIGIGTSDGDRKNAIEVMQNGDAYILGLGGYDGTNPGNSAPLKGVVDGKYVKPVTGIPSTDMTEAVQTSLGKADSALQEHQDISPKEDKANKITAFQTIPDNTHYPSEKLVKDSLDAKQPTIDASHKLDYSLLDNTPTIPTVPDISTDIATDATSDTKTASPKAVKTYMDGIVGNIETLLAAI